MQISENWEGRLEWTAIIGALFGPCVLVALIFGSPPEGEHSKYWAAVGLLSFVAFLGGAWLAQRLDRRLKEKRARRKKQND